MKTIHELQEAARLGAEEVLVGKNTKERVFGLIRDLIDYCSSAVMKETGKGLSSRDYTEVDYLNVQKIPEKVDKKDIINDLTTGGSTKALSAEGGKIMNNNVNILTKRINTNHYEMHRKDAEFAANNAVSIVTKTGRVITAFNSSFVYSDFINNSSCFIKKSDDRINWSYPELMFRPGNFSDINSNCAAPLLVKTQLSNLTERIWLFCYEKWDSGFITTPANEFLQLRYSDDNGDTWSTSMSLRGLTEYHNVRNMNNIFSGLVYASGWNAVVNGDWILIPVAERYSLSTNRWKPRYIAFRFRNSASATTFNNITDFSKSYISPSYESLLPVATNETPEVAMLIVGASCFLICRNAGSGKKRVLSGTIDTTNNGLPYGLAYIDTESNSIFNETTTDFGTPLCALTIPIEDKTYDLILFSNVPGMVVNQRNRLTIFGSLVRKTDDKLNALLSMVPLWRYNFEVGANVCSGSCNLSYDEYNRMVVITTTKTSLNRPDYIYGAGATYQNVVAIYPVPMGELLNRYCMLTNKTDLFL